jgi:hypothetical protein
MQLLKSIQTDLQGLLMSCADFASVDVCIQEGNGGKSVELTRDRLNRVLSGLKKTNDKAGLSMLIPMPEVRIEAGMQGVPGPQINLRVSVQVVENAGVNRSDKGTGITAESAAFTVLALGHLFQLGSGTILLADDRGIEPAELDDEMGADVAYQVNFTVPMSTQPLPKTSAPALSVNGGGELVLLGQVGAKHVVTLDGAFPWTGARGALVYDAPFLLPAGSRVRAASYLPDSLGSDIAELMLS